MIQIAITGLFILLFLKLVDKENVLDFFSTATLYVAPLVLVAVSSFAISYFALPIVFIFIAYLAYLIVPYFMLNAIYEDYSTKKKLILSIGIFAIVIVTEAIQVIVISGYKQSLA